MLEKFNPTIEKFLEKKKELTVIGLFWAGYWRLMLAIFAVYLFFMIFFGLFIKLFS